MQNPLHGPLALSGRILLALIFLMSGVGNKIPNFSGVTQYMASEGVPAPQLLLAGAIAFLVVGSASLILGFQARIGATLLLVFLVLATYYFHDFWTMEGEVVQQQTIQFLKNLGLMGAMLLVIVNGPGPWSLDHRRSERREALPATT